jgi:hypothetical protein
MARVTAGGGEDDVEKDPAYGGLKHVVLRLTHEEAWMLLAALHDYLRGDRSELLRRRLGKLIWMLEDADAWPREVGGHSADAVQPATRTD